MSFDEPSEDLDRVIAIERAETYESLIFATLVLLVIVPKMIGNMRLLNFTRAST
jgi:hypothetical protein